MKLHRLQIAGLKSSCDLDLAVPNLLFLRGPTGAGKTIVMDAIALLVNGWHPDMPRTADGVMRLADGDLLRVSGEWDGFTISRAWERVEIKRGKAKGSFRVETTVECDGLTGRAAEARIAELLGPPGSYGLADLLAATDSQRRRLLLDAGAKHAALSPEQVRADLHARQLDEAIAAWSSARTCSGDRAACFAPASSSRRLRWLSVAASRSARP